MTIITESRKLLWQDRKFAEVWEFRGQHVLRWRILSSYPWQYAIGQFTSAYQPYVQRRDRPMTTEEISAFKTARSI